MAKGKRYLRESLRTKTSLLGQGIFVDTDNHEIFVTNPFNNTSQYTIVSRGQVTKESLKDLILGFGIGIFIDTDNDKSLSITPLITRSQYDRIARGDDTPWNLRGPNTELDGPSGIFVAVTPDVTY
jgi:hypothetical protein